MFLTEVFINWASFAFCCTIIKYNLSSVISSNAFLEKGTKFSFSFSLPKQCHFVKRKEFVHMNRKSYSPHERPFYQAPILVYTNSIGTFFIFSNFRYIFLWHFSFWCLILFYITTFAKYLKHNTNLSVNIYLLIRKNCLNSNKVCNKVQSTYLSISRQQKLAYLFLKTGFTKPRDWFIHFKVTRKF